MPKATSTPPVIQQAATYPPDVAEMRRNALRLIGPESPNPGTEELNTLHLLLRGHIQLLLPEVEAMAIPLPKDDIPRACAMACTGEARMRLRIGWPEDSEAVRLAVARKLARTLNALCDHWENLAPGQA
ncbi:DUF6415 family natural product biosynthesis protein [Streptomyces sp. NPDC047009]|uniref:DUF6415 family natural product biosynthesis protein n=1 Tax=Streptomyces sp. NPDC047009 TaxID=3154496 RepID=UPI003402E859